MNDEGSILKDGKIPVPWSIRWREFRQGCLPSVVFLLLFIVTFFLWRENVYPRSGVGEVLAPRADVRSSVDGSLNEIHVKPHQFVRAGQLLATVSPLGAGVRNSQIQTELDYLEAQFENVTSRQRHAVNYSRLKLDWLRQGVVLAGAKVELERLEREFERSVELYETQLIAQNEFEIAGNRLDKQRELVAQTEALIADIKESLESLIPKSRSLHPSDPVPALEMLEERQAFLYQQMETEAAPISIRAPIGGYVEKIRVHAGQVVLIGDSILDIVSESAGQIVTYLNSRRTYEPQRGRKVELSCRGTPRGVYRSEIENVGHRFQQISGNLAHLSASDPIGLPIYVSIPEGMEAMPGELVDIYFLEP